MYWTLQ